MSTTHVPVLRDRVVALVAPALTEPDAVLVDATVGLGGHAEAVLDRCPHARLVGVDRDPRALETARTRLATHATRVTLVHAVYDTLDDVLRELGLEAARAVLFDLGVSSAQLDVPDRGFSYATDAPLDMRMDPTRGPCAADVLNTYTAAELARVLRSHGEERFARRIADAIVAERDREPFVSSGRLVSLIRDVIPAPARRTGGHPAKRTFQALRIEVNDELALLGRALPVAIDALAVGGRIVILSYHSLEDRLAKREIARRSRAGVPDGLPVVAARLQPELRVLTRGAERAGKAEMASNPRAASVRLRAAERIREVA